jgi:hypothetical protein
MKYPELILNDLHELYGDDTDPLRLKHANSPVTCEMLDETTSLATVPVTNTTDVMTMVEHDAYDQGAAGAADGIIPGSRVMIVQLPFGF